MSEEDVATRRQEVLGLAYERVCASFEGITEFRGKLLTLLPLATGAGGLLLLTESSSNSSSSAFLGPVGLFGVVVTAGLFMYEFRGIQRCQRLEAQAAKLEKQLGLNADLGQFRGQPGRRRNNMLGPPAAGLIVYLAVIFAWLYVAGVGLGLWNEGYRLVAWVLVPIYVGLLFAIWSWFRDNLCKWSEPGPDLTLLGCVPTTFETKLLPDVPGTIAPDGSSVRVLLGLGGGGLAHFELQPGQVSIAVHHRTVEEIWYFISGEGTMWRSDGEHAEEHQVRRGVCLTIPLGTHFQFRSEGVVPLAAVAATMPPWPGAWEAIRTSGPWSPTLDAGPGLASS